MELPNEALRTNRNCCSNIVAWPYIHLYNQSKWNWNETYWETDLSDQTNTQTYFFQNLVPRRVFQQNGIDITRNKDQNVKLVKQLMTDISSSLRKWYNIVIPPTDNCNKIKRPNMYYIYGTIVHVWVQSL